MSALLVEEPGPRYCHFPSDPGRGYTREYFKGLLSEKIETTPQGKERWKVVYKRNEPLDCRNYANAALRALHINMDEERRKLMAKRAGEEYAPSVQAARKRPARRADIYGREL